MKVTLLSCGDLEEDRLGRPAASRTVNKGLLLGSRSEAFATWLLRSLKREGSCEVGTLSF